MTSNDPRNSEAAQWMLDYLLENKTLRMEEAARLITKRFERSLAFVSESGKTRLANPLRGAFQRIAQGMVIWNNSKREWRLRDSAEG